jgi:glycosyltransferase involved in cell wall biosynthesis
MSEKPDFKLLLVVNFLTDSVGNYQACEDLARRLEKAGWLASTTSFKRNRVSRLIDMSTTAIRKRKQYSVAQVDVFSGLAFLWAKITCFTLRQINRPYILTLHGGSLPAFAKLWPKSVGRLLRSAAAVTTPSGYLFAHMKDYRRDLFLLPNPLDVNTYKFKLRKKPEPKLIWLRAFHAIYNPSLVPRVMDLLKGDFPDSHILMIGPDKLDGTLEATQQKAGALAVDDRITFPGRIPKSAVPKLINKGDIFLNTTNVDNAPVSVLEAMASGLCVVSTNVGGIPYLLDDEKDGLLVPPDDPEAMANAVHRILTEPGLAERLSRNARMKAEQFDWSVILPRWEKLLTSVANGKNA